MLFAACLGVGSCPRLALGALRGPQLAMPMGQKTLDMFVAKRPRLLGPQQAQPATAAAAGAAQEPAGPAAADIPAPAAGLSVASTAAAASPAAAAPATDADGAPQAEVADQQGGAGIGGAGMDQAEQLQWLRAHANRNAALAKQVVIRCERSGTLPLLHEVVIEDSWRSLLGDEMGKPYFQELQRFVHAEWRGTKAVFPPKDAVFRALNSCPVDAVKVVILGQDPYHDIGQAMGLSFSVPKGKPVPSSLRNIYKEIRDDLGCAIPTHGNLEKWAQQGVLLLNAVLTVRAHQAGSHAKKGWEQLTEAAISNLSRRRGGVVFLLWGRLAQDKARVICPNKHLILTAAHPSGLSANRGFFGCRHFSKANEFLEKEGRAPVDWQIDP